MTNTIATKSKRNTNKRVTKSNVEIASIVLKSIHDEIMRDNTTSTLTTKIMRTWLRVHMRDAHTHNSTWLFTSSQRHDIMMKFNAKYRATIERDAKRATKSNATPRVRKSRVIDAQTQTINNETNAIDANAIVA